MSGPKGYSVSVFNSQLSGIFQLQSSIQALLDSLSKLRVCDKGRNIEFDCRAFIESNQTRANQLLSPFTINHTGTIGQGLYDSYNRQLREKQANLESFLDLLKTEEKNFFDKQKDYHSFVSYVDYFQNAKDNFQAFKSQVIQYLESYVQEEYPGLFKMAKNSIEAVEIQVKKTEFDFGFRHIESEQTAKIKNDIHKCESVINVVRMQTSDKVAKNIARKNLPNTSFPNTTKLSGSDKTTRKINARIETIKALISEIGDPKRKKTYQDQLEQLIQSQSFRDEYYYTELLEDIKAAEKIHRWKTDIHKAIVKLTQMRIHDKFRSEKVELLQSALNVAEKQRIKAYEYEDFQAKLKFFNKKNERSITEAFVRAKERQFIKAQLIQSLKGLDYEVMNDMNVIDFEKESDFLINIPGQSNYLNLRFHQDGSFLYSFVIPESKDELSIDQKQQKLGEMETTCNVFKDLLSELSLLGLKMDHNKQMPVSEKALIQVPKKYRAMIREKVERAEVKQAEKKNYLTKGQS